MSEYQESAFSVLTPTEARVLTLISEGQTNGDIAIKLNLAEGTVRNYVSSILNKLGVNNRAEAAAYAVKNGLKDS
jgi:DNA-binding NarL/FixJ family response regulator